jgi:hypothetical protein
MSRVRNLIDFNHRVMDMDGDATDTITADTITADTITADTVALSSAGTPTLASDSDIKLTASTGVNNRVEITQSSLKLASFTTAQIALKTGADGDLVYDRDLHKIQAYANSAWTDLNSDPGLTGITDNATGSVLTLSDSLISSVVPVQLGNLTITDEVSILNTMNIVETIEQVDIDTSTSATINFDFKTSAVKLLSIAQTANRTINFRASSSASLDSIMSVGESMTCAILATQGATPYYLNSYQIDSSGITVKWSGGEAPTAGNASSTDLYSFTVIKTASATFTVLGSLTQYT